jgi:hypothetical protein
LSRVRLSEELGVELFGGRQELKHLAT